MKRVAFGFLGYFRGLKFWLSSAELVRISLVPVLLDSVLFGVGLYWGLSKIQAAISALGLSPTGGWQTLFYYATQVAAVILVFIVVTLLVLVVANLVAFPFHDKLSERTLALSGVVDKSRGRILGNLFVAIRKSILFAFLALFVFVAQFIPGLGTAAGFAALLIMSYDFADYSFDHLGFGFGQRFGFFMNHFLEFVGFALALSLGLSIPILNFVAIPGSVVAAAYLVAQVKKAK